MVKDGDSVLTLEQWLKQESDLQESGFAPDRRRLNAVDPDKWPLTMRAVDWDRQFLLWHHGCNDVDPPGEGYDDDNA